MQPSLADLDCLVIDCQAGGATPAYGDLLELGWAVCNASGIIDGVHGHWIVPRTQRRIPAAVRELVGWDETCVQDALHERDAWSALHADVMRLSGAARPPRVPTLIHFARFELGFLRDLHARMDEGGEFPFDTVCLHAIASRLFPELPRRNIRALAGYLGHSTGLLRRSAGHVEASAFIWRAMLPLLAQAGVATWGDLTGWLADAPKQQRRAYRSYPLAVEVRQTLPDRAGVYRFVRRNGDVLYVGKAASLKKRVAGHFKRGGRRTERELELLTQVHDIGFTETGSVLEAALLEADEIKRLDPPYNVQLRAGERQVWFASRDLRDALPQPDPSHRIGPLPSARAVSGLAALAELAQGEKPTPQRLAIALAVPIARLPDASLFDEGWRAFQAELLSGAEPHAARRVAHASRALWLLRGRNEPEGAAEDAAPDAWDLARVRRRLERNLVQAGLLVRRARWLCMLAEATIAFRERGMSKARALVLSHARIVETLELDELSALHSFPKRAWPSLHERREHFDAAAYDRLRVLATELARVQRDNGEIALRFGSRIFRGAPLAALMRSLY
jgi:DNA polymerase III subunit epsilon